MPEFDELIVHREPEHKKKTDAWQTAIGVQDVDGLKISPDILDTVPLHIEDSIVTNNRFNIVVYH